MLLFSDSFRTKSTSTNTRTPRTSGQHPAFGREDVKSLQRV